MPEAKARPCIGMETSLRDARALAAALYALAQADDTEAVMEARDVVAHLLCDELAETTRLQKVAVEATGGRAGQ